MFDKFAAARLNLFDMNEVSWVFDILVPQLTRSGGRVRFELRNQYDFVCFEV